MKIGIIGLGSIGQKHVRSLLQLGQHKILALRSRKGSIRNLPDDFGPVKMVARPEDFFRDKPDGVIISNPTSLHIKTLQQVLEHDIPVFVEKPLASSLAELEGIAGSDTSRIMVGFCLRHHEVIKAVKKILDSKKAGTILKASLYCGNYLPFWHPYADYRKEYFSRSDLGGGVLRTLSHETDLMHYLTGPVEELVAFDGRLSSLEIDVDDTATMLCRMEDGSLTLVELDYLNASFVRKGMIFCSNGTIRYSFNPPEVVFTDYKGRARLPLAHSRATTVSPDDAMYRNQMKNFLEVIRGKEEPLCKYSDGVEVMRVIDAVERSAKRKKWQKIKR